MEISGLYGKLGSPCPSRGNDGIPLYVTAYQFGISDGYRFPHERAY